MFANLNTIHSTFYFKSRVLYSYIISKNWTNHAGKRINNTYLMYFKRGVTAAKTVSILRAINDFKATAVGKAAMVAVTAPLAFGAAAMSFTGKAYADGPARASNEISVEVQTRQAPADWSRKAAHNWALQAAGGLKQILLVYYGTNQEELGQVIDGARRTVDSEDNAIVYGVMHVNSGDGTVVAYSPNGKFVYFNQGGGDPMIKWRTSGEVVKLYNETRPDQIASLSSTEPIRK